ncbi:MAG TPA: tRNA guanosine(15) transglycosylase TgtA [Nitrososphaeraceae archaeon]|nr:tRNA guanosine(15) transglycosylase TgtA [Nitrososphaeraceae archaeon]
MSFEVRYTDLAGRIGQLKTMHGVLETPAFLPVVHPVEQVIRPQFLSDLGFKAVITNAYITFKRHKEQVLRRGIHNLIDFDGIVMTDSGGYQVLEYGDIEIRPESMAKFQIDIKSDLPVMLDRPTGYGLDHGRAKDFVLETIRNARSTVNTVKDVLEHGDEIAYDEMCDLKGQIWIGTIQGAEHLDLVKYSTMELVRIGFDFFALGSPVEVMEAYDFSLLAKMILTTKEIIPNKPLHLFGAGHPLAISLAVALGCDSFDSASYLLYARDNRYITPYGTAKLDELTYLPCSCPVCSFHSVSEFRSMTYLARTIELAKHNLYILKLEINMLKQAIMDGRLWEYLVQKARSHPKLMDALAYIKNHPLIESGTRRFKNKAAFFYDSIDRCRPEAKQYREMVARFKSSKSRVLFFPDQDTKPFYTSNQYAHLVKEYEGFQICTYNAFLGIIPVELCDIYPASHNLTSETNLDDEGIEFYYHETIKYLKSFLKLNHFEEIVIYANKAVRDSLNRSPIDQSNIRILEYEKGKR